MSLVTLPCAACGNPFSRYRRTGGILPLYCGRACKDSIPRTTHNASKTPEYKVWASICNRTGSQNSKYWHRYGGRGIKMCARWRDDFAAFSTDMGPRPPGGTVERIDNDGDYEPKNCKWASQAVQCRNTNRVALNVVAVCIGRHLRRRGLMVRDIAEAFGVAAQTMSSAISGTTWAHVFDGVEPLEMADKENGR